MDNAITKGLKIDTPDIFIPWLISPSDLERLFSNANAPLALENKTEFFDPFYVAQTRLFVSIDCQMYFTFNYKKLFTSKLNKISLSRNSEYWQNHTLDESYNDFQHHLELAFGKPHKTWKCTEHGFTYEQDFYEWRFSNVIISHRVYEHHRFFEDVEIKLNNFKPYSLK